MDFVLSLVFWFIGGTVALATVCQTMLVLLFAVPLTAKLAAKGQINWSDVLWRMAVQVAVSFGLLALALVGMHMWFPSHWVAFWIGFAMSCVPCLFRCGTSVDNVSDYKRVYGHFLKGSDPATNSFFRKFSSGPCRWLNPVSEYLGVADMERALLDEREWRVVCNACPKIESLLNDLANEISKMPITALEDESLRWLILDANNGVQSGASVDQIEIDVLAIMGMANEVQELGPSNENAFS